MFKALLLENTEGFSASVKQLDESLLPAGDVHVAVAYSIDKRCMFFCASQTIGLESAHSNAVALQSF